MRAVAVTTAFLLAASSAAAQPPPRDQFEADSLTIAGEIVSIDLTAPMSKIRVRDAATGKTWIVEGATSNTLVRGGALTAESKGLLTVVGFQSKDRVCAPDCRLRMREITFPDGRRVFLGAAGPA